MQYHTCIPRGAEWHKFQFYFVVHVKDHKKSISVKPLTTVHGFRAETENLTSAKSDTRQQYISGGASKEYVKRAQKMTSILFKSPDCSPRFSVKN